MKAEWLANVDGQEYGPYTWQQMLQMAAEGRVPSDLPVRRVNDKRWFKASQVPGLLTPATVPAAVSSQAAPAARKGDSQLKRAKPLVAAASAAAPPAPPAPPAAPPAPARAAVAAPPAVAAQTAAVPVIVTEPRPKTAAPTGAADQPHVPQRGTSRLLLAGIAIGVTAVVLLVAATVVWIVWQRGDGSNQQAPVAAAGSDGNSNQQGETGTSSEPTQAADRAKGAKPGDGPTKNELAAQAKLVQSISNWQTLAGFKSASISSASLEVKRVWRTDAAGDDQQTSSAKKYVCVEVAISNKSSSPLKYRGWNTYGPNGAVLADESKHVLPLVPVAKTPDFERVASTSVPGNGRITDVLVFEAPSSDDEVLHLVLPYGVFYTNVRPPYRAIEVTPDMVNVDLAAARAGGRIGGEAEEVVRGPGAAAEPSGDDTPPATAPAPTPTQPKGVPLGRDGKTPSIKDLIDNDPGTPKPDEPAGGKGDPKRPESKPGGTKPETPKKPENPFEPKPSDDSPKPAPK